MVRANFNFSQHISDCFLHGVATQLACLHGEFHRGLIVALVYCGFLFAVSRLRKPHS